MPKHLIALAQVLVTSAVLTGCGDDGSTVFVAGKDFDACTLITSEDVSSQFGVEFDVPEKSHRLGNKSEGTYGSCSYTSLEGVAESMAEITEYLQNVTHVTVAVWAWPTTLAAKTYIDRVESFEQEPVKELNELGDEAFRSGARTGAIHVRRGKVCLSVSIHKRSMSLEEDRAIELRLTELALSRL